jgi:hypothetical protein
MEYTGPKINGVPTQSIAKRSGIPVNMISKLCGIDATLIGLPGTGGASCTTVYYGYSDGQRNPPGSACTESPINFDWDDANQVLYQGGGCGNPDFIARHGYYSDGTRIYFWDPTAEKPFSEYDTCTPPIQQFEFGYAMPGATPSDACSALYLQYWLNTSTNTLYSADPADYDNGSAPKANDGYYSDGTTIYSWSLLTGWTEYGSCTPPPPTGPVNLTAPSFGTSQLVYGEYSSTLDRGTWTGTGDITYVYNFYSNGLLLQTQGPFPTPNPKGGFFDQQPFIIFGPAQLFTTIRLEVVATDDLGSTSAHTDLKLTEPKLNTFLANSGITNPTRVAALEYLQKAILTSTSQLNISDMNLDYYPFAGETDEQNKWSLGNPSEYLQFIGTWSHSSNGSQANYGIAQSTRAYNNSFNNIQFAYGMYTNTNEDSSIDDLRLLQTYGNQSYAWSFRPQQRVAGVNKVYWTAVTTTGVVQEFTVNLSAGSVGLSGLYRSRSNTGVNEMSVISGGSMQTAITFAGNFGLYNNSVFIVGNGTKNYQFAFIANYITGEQVTELNTILQTYNSMLGR